MESPQIPELRFIDLPSHTDCPIAYTLKSLKGSHIDTISSSSSSSTKKSIIWLIFVNGLGLPQAFWQPTIQLLESELTSNTLSISPSHGETYATTYDRYGQGQSRPQLNGHSNSSDWTPAPHNCLDAANELAELIHLLRPIILSSHDPVTTTTAITSSSDNHLQIVLISHSLGVPITRLFVEHHGTSEIAGLILIDSNMANINMVDLLPSGTETLKLPSDTTIEQLRWTRANYTKLFSPTAPNAENLDRVSLLTLLPRSDAPVLLQRYHEHGSGSKGGEDADERGEKRKRNLALTVIAHDPEAFAEEGLRIATKGLTREYIEPAWREYNRGLLHLNSSEEEKAVDDDDHEKRVVVAPGAGHFVQRDNPRCVADEVWKLLKRLW